MIRSILFVALATVSITACSKKSDTSGTPSDNNGEVAKVGDKPNAPQGDKSGTTKLPKLGLVILAPGSEVSDSIGGDGHMLMGGAVGALSIDSDKDPAPTEADVKSDADMFSPKNYNVEKLDDGFAATYDNTGGMGANYFVEVHRKIGDKSYKCSTTVSNADQQKASLLACKSLKKP